jgi:hypothetical protein
MTIASESIHAGAVLSSEEQLKNCALFVEACKQIGVDLRGTLAVMLSLLVAVLLLTLVERCGCGCA